MSKDAHLYRYLGEFDSRYNIRKITDSESTQQAIQMTTGKAVAVPTAGTI